MSKQDQRRAIRCRFAVEKNRARENTIDPRIRIPAQRNVRAAIVAADALGRERSTAQLGWQGELGCHAFIAAAPGSAADADR